MIATPKGKAVLYVRVSDARQVDNTSLASQEEICRRWCDAQGLRVERVFVERGESAKSTNRTEFQAMFRYLEGAPKGTISHLVVYKFDRFSRDSDDGAAYRMILRSLKIAMRSATETTDDSPAGRLMVSVLGATAQFDNETRAERALNGMKNSLERGRWQWPAPTGYLIGGKPGPSLVPDPERGPMIKRLFELVATGEHTKASALATVTALGLRSKKGAPLTKETIRKMLVNPVYAGEMLVKKWGRSVPGDFEPLISRELFDRVSVILAGRAPAHVAHKREREDFPLRGWLLCPKCGLPVTASLSTGKLGKKFGYYRCHRVKGHLNVRGTFVEDAFVALLFRLTPKPERMSLIQQVFRRSWKQRTQAALVDSADLRKELATQEARKSRILEQMADGHLAAGDFTALNKKTIATIVDLRERLSVSEANEVDVEAAIEYLTHLLWNTGIVWQTSHLHDKQSIQRRLFPDGLTYSKDGFGTPVTHSIYSLLGDDSVLEEGLVGREGLEPPTSCL